MIACMHGADVSVQYIPRNMHTVFALLCFVVVIHWLIFPYPSSLLHWHCGNLTIAPVPAKQPWWIWINTSCDYERLHNHNKAKHNKTVCIFLGIYCTSMPSRFDILLLGSKVKFISTTDCLILKKYYVLNWSIHKAVCVGYRSLRLVYNLACIKYMTGNDITIDKTCLTISNTYQALLWNAGLTFAV